MKILMAAVASVFSLLVAQGTSASLGAPTSITTTTEKTSVTPFFKSNNSIHSTKRLTDFEADDGLKRNSASTSLEAHHLPRGELLTPTKYRLGGVNLQ